VFSQRTGALFLVSAVLFGGTFIAAKAGLAYFPPLFFVAVRFDIGAVVLAAFAATSLSRSELRPRTVGDIIGILATGVLVIGLTNALLFVGQQDVTSGVAAVVFSLNPILTPVFAAVLLSGDRLSVRGSAGMVLGLLGVGLVANPDSTALLGGGIGIPLLFGAAVTSALGAVVIRRAESTMSSTARTVWGVPLAAVLSHGLSLSAGESVTGLSVPQSRSQRCSTSASFFGSDRVSRLLCAHRRDRCDASESPVLLRPDRLGGRGLGPAWRRCRSSHWSGLESSSSVSCSSVVSPTGVSGVLRRAVDGQFVGSSS